MRRASIKFSVYLFLFLVLLIILNKYFLKNKFVDWSLAIVKRPAVYMFEKSSLLGSIAGKVIEFNHLADENLRLREKNQNLLSQKAQLESLQEENNFLKRAIGFNDRVAGKKIMANIFASSLGPAGYETILNKGQKDDIEVGDVAVSQEGFLIGIVRETMAHTSKLNLVTDPSFSATVKILSSQTRGIAKGKLDQGLFVDLIAQDDVIQNGDVMVTSGNDRIPSALVVGTVRDVQSDGKTVFKKVWLRPAMKDIILGRILVIKVNE